ncbi:MAG TPA: demethylmenaquinone methyltransferase [Oscillospiraceae bacterium]|nr:demethylmenaquinone methyltransferase [Oscillospiraceae bacterium]
MQRKQEVNTWRFFEQIADRYDLINSLISFRQHQRWRKQTMKQLTLRPGQRVLDLCCGTCDWTVELAKAVGAEGKVVGLDFSQQMLVQGRAKIAQANLQNVELICDNALQLPFSNDCFDYVTIGFGLRNVQNYQQVIKEMYRVVKPAGTAVCLETSQPSLLLYKQLYHFYFKYAMPLIGKIVSNNYEAYNWLQQSTFNFLNKAELAQLFIDNGFSQVFVHSFSGGVAAMHLCIK